MHTIFARIITNLQKQCAFSLNNTIVLDTDTNLFNNERILRLAHMSTRDVISKTAFKPSRESIHSGNGHGFGFKISSSILSARTKDPPTLLSI